MTEAEVRAADSDTDLVFIRDLRVSVTNYLRAVDSWESAYQRFYRLTAPQRAVTPDLQDAHDAYVRARWEFSRRIPRTRQLCMKYNVRDSISGLLRVELGQNAPQVQNSSAIGRNERAAAAESLADLESRCVEAQHESTHEAASLDDRPRKGLLRRVLDYFV